LQQGFEIAVEIVEGISIGVDVPEDLLKINFS
jgi:CMP-2-keto-3-deoxyoctulosonic acid synthetase